MVRLLTISTIALDVTVTGVTLLQTIPSSTCSQLMLLAGISLSLLPVSWHIGRAFCQPLSETSPTFTVDG